MSKKNNTYSIIIDNEVKAISEAVSVIANERIANCEAKLFIANIEKSKHAGEMALAIEEKGKRAAELVIANADKAKRAAELVIANAEKAKRAAELVISNVEKEHLADELIIADKEIIFQNAEKLKLASELVIADVSRTKREAELVIANIEKTKLIARLIITETELSFQKEEKSKRAAKLVIADAEKAKRSADLVKANIEKARRAARLVIANIEKARRSAELVIANKELVYQKSEKSKREAELVIAKVLKAKRSAELVIANIEKTKRAAEYVVVSKELVLSQEKERLIEELNSINEELRIEIEKRLQSEEALREDLTERKKTECLLKESELKYRSLIENSSDAIFCVDERGEYKFVNQLFASAFGKTPDYFIGKTFWDIYDKEHADTRFETSKRLFKTGHSESLEVEVPLKDKTLYFWATTNPVKDETGKVVLNLTHATEITERKKMELSLEESKKTAERYLNVVAELIMSLDADGNITMLNDSGHRLLGYDKDELLGKNWFITCLPYETSDNVSGVFEKLMRGEIENLESFENLVLTKGGDLKTIQFYNTVLTNGDGTIKGTITSGRDITDHLKAEETLRNSFIFNETLLKTIPFGMDIVDETGTVLFQSENFKKLFGEGAIGEKCWTLYRDDKKQCSDCPLYKGIIPGQTETYESHGVLGNKIFEISHTGMLYQGKKAMLEIFQDITARKAIEEELKSAKQKAEESDRLKSAFLSNMSHEIRTPMNGILGFAELLKEPTLTAEEQQEYIRTIGISGERMLSTINSIVDISKIEAGMVHVDIKDTNINDKVIFTYKFFKPEVESKSLQFLYRYGLPADNAIIKTDNEKVYAILTNLVKNAIKFTHSGSIEFGYEKKGECLEFYVKDTGTGIPEDKKELIFERFRQGSESHYRGYDGSGLGLSICKSYVEMLGGRIWVESEVGLGSTFYFTIPYNPVSGEITNIKDFVSHDHKEVHTKSLKILIVEDDEISYSLIARAVQKISIEVLHAVTGIEAIQTCQNNPDLDLILMDIRMPMMNGLEATKKIRQFNNDIIIIAQTAYGFSSDVQKALEAGCNDFISKPINKAKLYELVRKHCYMSNGT